MLLMLLGTKGNFLPLLEKQSWQWIRPFPSYFRRKIPILLGQWNITLRPRQRFWISGKMTVFSLCVCSFMHFLCEVHLQLSPLLSRPGLPQGIHVSTDGDLTQTPGWDSSVKPPLGCITDTGGREPIHVAVGVFPLRCLLFLESIPHRKDDVQHKRL